MLIAVVLQTAGTKGRKAAKDKKSRNRVKLVSSREGITTTKRLLKGAVLTRQPLGCHEGPTAQQTKG